MIDLRNILKHKRASQDDSSGRAQLLEVPVPTGRDAIIGRTIAIVPGAYSVRMATVSHRGSHRTVLDVREVPIPEDRTEPADRRLFVQQAIGAYLGQFGGRSVSVRLAVSGKETAFRSFFMPLLKSHDLRDAVHLEATRQLPFPAGDCTLDYRPVARIVSGDQTRYKVALFAATNRRVAEAQQPFVELGETVDAIYHSHDVVGQILPSLPDFKPDQAYTILSIGQHSAEIAFYRGSTLEFFHQTNTGSDMAGDLTDATRREFFAETLATDIQTSFDFFSGQHASSSMPVIHVCGLPAGDDDLMADLAERVGMPCQHLRIETMHGISFASDDIRREALTLFPVVAAALNNCHTANLLPEPTRAALQKRRVDTIGRIVMAATVVLLAGGWMALHRHAQIDQQQAISLKEQVSLIENSEAYRAFQQLQVQLRAGREYIKRTEKQPSYLGLNLKEMSYLVPKNLRLTRYDITTDSTAQATDNLRLYGVVISDDIPPEVTLAEFVERLSASPYYDKVEVERHVKRERDGVFTIDFQLVMRGVV